MATPNLNLDYFLEAHPVGISCGGDKYLVLVLLGHWCTGYLGSSVVYQLLQSGYASEGAKLDYLRESVGNHYPLLELVRVGDIFLDHLSEVLKSVYAVIHGTAVDDTPTAIKAVQYLREAHPGLSDTLPSIPEEVYGLGGSGTRADVDLGPKPNRKKLIQVAKADNTRAKKLLGMEKWIDWRQSPGDTVEWLLKAETIWKERGVGGRQL
ncbi:hypothetical protein AX16_005110 [Volvariella volvacea WC 439]|nr:hypothetical protein AX16_005110 [Volvariella volvacea WC 439]